MCVFSLIGMVITWVAFISQCLKCRAGAVVVQSLAAQLTSEYLSAYVLHPQIPLPYSVILLRHPIYSVTLLCHLTSSLYFLLPPPLTKTVAACLSSCGRSNIYTVHGVLYLLYAPCDACPQITMMVLLMIWVMGTILRKVILRV